MPPKEYFFVKVGDVSELVVGAISLLTGERWWSAKVKTILPCIARCHEILRLTISSTVELRD